MKIRVMPGDTETDRAVVMAMASRSPLTYEKIWEKVKSSGSSLAFMDKTYLDYGHDSVAEGVQCPTIAIEDVSDLAANVVALSDPQLVVQMASTRYQDLDKAKLYGRHGAEDDTGVAEKMMEQYRHCAIVVEKILDGRDDIERKHTLKFDIARGFLPAGVQTKLGIRGNARTMRDAVCFMLGSHLEEVREIGRQIRDLLKIEVPVLFDRHIVSSEVQSKVSLDRGSKFDSHWMYSFCASQDTLEEIIRWRTSRYRRRLRTSCGGLDYATAVIGSDWGGYRDLRRNRTVHQEERMPTQKAVPEDSLWAFRQLYPDLCTEIEDAMGDAIKHQDHDQDTPYLAAMGSLCSWRAGALVVDWAYFFRLRSSKTCHPAYSIPTRELMRGIVRMSSVNVSLSLGIRTNSKSLCGVEFEDRIEP